ncbi:MAG TPA: hypothetical protein VMD77_13670 [Candidatus Baltobacteraceae bacterium]|jgi:hypothetical protein|nr:hypothetical protein [Candidatus Baltobacteraceae bacterium]
MTRMICKWIVLSAVVLAPAASFAQVSCTRDGLQAATNLYLDAQTKGDPSGMPLATGLAYIENMQVVDIKTGVIEKPLKIDFHRTLIDTATCQTFTEVIVTDKTHPYVLGTRLRVNHDKIAEIESMVTQQGDWLFNADNYYKWSPNEDWGTIPPDQRDSRDTLVAAANAYLDAFLEKKLDLVPWGYPCNRTEGGVRTGKGAPDDSCSVGVPSGVNIVARRFIVDETMGAVVAFCTFGVGGLPDTHLFRVEKGKLRYVHTLTHVPAGYHVRVNGKPVSSSAPNNPASDSQANGPK